MRDQNGHYFKSGLPAEILSRIRSGNPLQATPIGSYSFEDLDREATERRRVSHNERARAKTKADREEVARRRSEREARNGSPWDEWSFRPNRLPND